MGQVSGSVVFLRYPRLALYFLSLNVAISGSFPIQIPTWVKVTVLPSKIHRLIGGELRIKYTGFGGYNQLIAYRSSTYPILVEGGFGD
jgi:hypothetical protein